MSSPTAEVAVLGGGRGRPAPLAIPPLICGILLIYIVGPYSFLGQLSGERLTETMYGWSSPSRFVSAPSSSWWPAAPSVPLTVTRRRCRHARPQSTGSVPPRRDPRGGGRPPDRDDPHVATCFREYGTTVVLAYTLQPAGLRRQPLLLRALSEAEAPTLLAIGVAALAIVVSRIRRPGRVRPQSTPPRSLRFHATDVVGFDLDATIGTFACASRTPGAATA